MLYASRFLHVPAALTKVAQLPCAACSGRIRCPFVSCETHHAHTSRTRTHTRVSCPLEDIENLEDCVRCCWGGDGVAPGGDGVALGGVGGRPPSPCHWLSVLDFVCMHA